MKYPTIDRFRHRQRIGNLCIVCGRSVNTHPTSSCAPYQAYWLGSDLVTCAVICNPCVADSIDDDDDFETQNP